MGINSIRFDARRKGRGSIRRKLSGSKGQADAGMVLQSDGRVYCWGRGTNGQLGNNTVTSTSFPVAVSGNHFFKDIGCGTVFKVGIKTDGTAWGWGNNGSGQLGDNSVTQRSSPISAVGGHSFIAIGAGDLHVVAIKADGTAWAWGSNNTGRLGDGTATNRSSPTSVIGDHSFVAIAVGNNNNAGLKADGSVWTWGVGTAGQLGDTSATSKSSPVSVTGSGSSYIFTSIAAGDSHIVALRSDGTVMCWGSNDFGEQGDNAAGHRSFPHTIAISGVRFSGIGAGADISLAFADHGHTWVWGVDSLRVGSLGSGTNTQYSSPVLVVNRNIRPAYVAGSNQTNAQGASWFLTADGSVWGSGPQQSTGQQIGDLDPRSPMIVSPEKSFAAIACAHQHSAALDSNGCIWTWGESDSGRLGAPQERSWNTIYDWTVPTLIAGSAGRSWAGLPVGQGADGITFALRDDGTVWAWGVNIGSGFAGGFGIPGRPINYSLPQAVYIPGQFFHEQMEDQSFKQITVSRVGGHALRHDNILYGWGTGISVGNNASTTVTPPELVWGGTFKFSALAAGNYSFAVGISRIDGTAWYWGNNVPIGAGSASVPTSVIGGHSFINVIDAGIEHVVALKADGSAWCWGEGTQGQLGNSSLVSSSSPVSVVGGHSFIDVKTSDQGTAGLKADGTVWCWGRQNGGNVALSSSPVSVAGGHSFVQLEHTAGYVALKADGSAWTWGPNYLLGNNTFPVDDASSPVSVAGNHVFTKVAGCKGRAYGIKTDGSAWGWGNNDGDRAILGIGSVENTVSSPVSIVYSRMRKIVDIDGGPDATYFIDSSGNAYACGHGSLDSADLGFGKARTGVYNQAGIPLRMGGPARRVVNGDNLVFPTYITGTQDAGYSLLGDGHFLSWGTGSGGRLGDDQTSNRSSPKISGVYKWSSVSGGFESVVALRTSGAAFTWGSNSNGLLGDGTVSNRSTPVPVVGDHVFVAVDAGISHMAARKSNGTVWTWGLNSSLQLGDGTGTARTSPVSVVGGHSFIQVITGDAVTCALKQDGSAWTWGLFSNGALGNNSTASQSSPTSVVGDHSFASLAYGNRLGFLALKGDGSAWGWGSNVFGQLGDNSTTDRSSPVSVVGGFSFIQLTESRGNGSTSGAAYGLLANGEIWSWGSNTSGRLGNLSGTNTSSPILVASGPNGFKDAIKVAVTATNTAWLAADGQAYVTGLGTSGELGFSSSGQSFFTSTAAGSHTFADISGGFNHFVAIKSDGTCWAWGANTSGKLGDNASVTAKTSPISVAGDHSFIKIAGGLNQSMGLKIDGSIWTWGEGSTGQLGDGTATDRSSPVSVLSGGLSFFDIAASGDTVGSLFALGDNGTCWAWGYNNVGRLGDGSVTNRTSPVSVVGGHSFIKIEGGAGHTLALKADGSIWSWGLNDQGQLGDMTFITKSSPVSVKGAHSWSDIAAGIGTSRRSMALRADGKIFVWGQRNEIANMSYMDRTMARIFR